MKRRHTQRRAPRRFTYTRLHVLLASATEPMPEAVRTHHLTRMWQGLASLERDTQPTPEAWRLCSDAVNVMESLVDMGVCQDERGLLHDAVQALALAGARHVDHGQPIRLSGPGMIAVRGVLEDYADVLAHIPHRIAVEAHRATERRVRDILEGRGQAHDVKVTSL